MSIALPSIRVGDPIRHGSLSVFPLYCESQSGVDYRLADEALGDKTLLVTEIDDQGSVPDLLVENQGDSRVLFLEGEELIGAKQNRVLNTSVLVAPHSKLKIPVSCVEQGRWRQQSRYFGPSGSHSPSKLRRALKASVTKSVKDNRGHESDQLEVWREVASLHADHAVASVTAAMSDAFDTYQEKIAEYRDNLKYVSGASGVAVAVGERVVSVDLFDKPSTCEKVWKRMLSGVVFDALSAGEVDKVATTSDVQQLVSTTSQLDWQPAKAVGEGEEYRAESGTGDHASALTLNQTIVHGSVLANVD